MNKYVHPRNPYKTRIDFKLLATAYPSFASLLDEDSKLDFSIRQNTIMLTKCLLHRDYGVNVEFPENSLTPSLTLKMNYLLWIEDLLLQNNYFSGAVKEPKKIVGLDIGTGGALLFPILAVKHFGWSMLSTENNKDDCDMASKNIRCNGLDGQIKIFHNPDKDTIFNCFGQENPIDNISFTMVNPPFYDTEDYEGLVAASNNEENPQMLVAGRKHEMTTDGGEIVFVKKMIIESMMYRTTIKIFTAMLGRKKSVTELKNYIQNIPEIQSVTVSEFCQGRIMRWGLGWTFDPEIHLDDTAPSNFMKSKQEKKKNAPFTLSLEPNVRFMDSVTTFNIISDLILNDLCASNVTNRNVGKQFCSIQFSLNKPTWRNQRAKRRKEDRLLEGPSVKRSRMDTDDSVSSESLLETFLTIANVEQENISKIEIQFFCKDGTLGRGGLYELVQYFKNKLTNV